MIKTTVRLACSAAVMFAFSLSAQAAINLSDTIPVGPQVKVGKLPNGLTYYIQKNSKPEKTLELRLVVKAGSIVEDDDQQGLAHFVEHMAFNGSTNFKKNELVSYLQSVGVKFGADLNASTSFNETIYMLTVPTASKQQVDKALLVLGDWAHGVSFDGSEIDRERGVVLEEARLAKGVQDRINRVLLPEIFEGSRYAKRLPIGQEAIIGNFKHDTLKRFYKDWYRPDLMAVILVGDIEPAEAEKMIKARFAQLKNPAKPRALIAAPIATRTKTESLIVTDKEMPQNLVMIRYPTTAAAESGTFAGYREKMLQNLMTMMLNQRLGELTQSATPPYLGAGSALDTSIPRYRAYTATAALGKDGIVPAIDALVQENARARQFGFGADELARAKKNLLSSLEGAYKERDKSNSAGLAAEYGRNFLIQESIPGIENEFKYAGELIPAITLDDMNSYTRATIPADSAKLVVYIGSSNASTPAPSGPQLLAAVAAAEKTEVKANEEKKLAASLMEQLPTPGKIVAETQDKVLGLTRLTLSNGVKVVLKPTDFQNDEVLLSVRRFGGQYRYDDADMLNARYAQYVVDSMGLNKYSPTDFMKITAGRKASLNSGLAEYTDDINGGSVSADVETMLQMLYLRMTGVRRDDDLFKAFVGAQVEGTRNLMAQPEMQFQDAVNATLFTHPRGPRIPRPADFEKINLERAIAIYSERFGSAKDMTLFMVGSFDVAKLKPLLETYVASLPVADIATSYRDIALEPVKGVVKKEVRAGAEAKSVVTTIYSGPATYSDQEMLRFYGLVEAMNLRITENLREKQSLIYTGGMNGAFNWLPKGSYTIRADLPTSPANAEKVINALATEIAHMKEHGPDKAALNKVKQNWLQNHQKLMKTNGHWLNNLQTSMLQGSDPARILQFEKRLEQLSANDLKQAANRYLNGSNVVQVVLYPEK